MTSLLPLLLVVHIALAVALVIPSILVPFLLRRGGDRASRFVAVQGRWSGAIGIGLLVTGLGLLAVLGFDLVTRPWLLVALVLYAVTLVLALFVQQPRLRWLGRGAVAVGSGADAVGDPTRREAARRVRYLAYVIAGLTGSIGFLMATKPALW
jgi:Predicted integral membrane protein (DUF2269)